MGRGRAKAKQTKVARALKYGGPQTDFDRLQAELASSEVPARPIVEIEADDEDELDDPYAKYYEDDEEEAAER
ncbi:MAG: DUF3073 domain-containing protein [Candidatus Nanopelagicales bacterium]